MLFKKRRFKCINKSASFRVNYAQNPIDVKGIKNFLKKEKTTKKLKLAFQELEINLWKKIFVVLAVNTNTKELMGKSGCDHFLGLFGIIRITHVHCHL